MIIEEDMFWTFIIPGGLALLLLQWINLMNPLTSYGYLTRLSNHSMSQRILCFLFLVKQTVSSLIIDLRTVFRFTARVSLTSTFLSYSRGTAASNTLPPEVDLAMMTSLEKDGPPEPWLELRDQQAAIVATWKWIEQNSTNRMDSGVGQSASMRKRWMI